MDRFEEDEELEPTTLNERFGDGIELAAIRTFICRGKTAHNLLELLGLEMDFLLFDLPWSYLDRKDGLIDFVKVILPVKESIPTFERNLVDEIFDEVFDFE